MFSASSACFLINKPSGFGAPSRGMGVQPPHGYALDFIAAAIDQVRSAWQGSGFNYVSVTRN